MELMNEILLIASLLLISAILFNKIGGKFGVPSLVIFILLGILAGSDGILGIHFEDYALSQFIGIVAISYILFMGGLSLNTKELKPVFNEGLTLATAGVILTGIITGVISYYILDLPFLHCMLLGSIVSSTDAAAVFSVLRSKSISLSNNLKPLLEFESGSNDPTAAFLTLGTIGLITSQLNLPILILEFFKQMILGALLGFFVARLTVWFINKIKLEYDSLYVVITFASVLLCYSVVSLMGGNGFIGVYVCGLTMSSLNFANKKTLSKFHDAIAWIMQIVMFLILGLLVNFKDGFSFTKQALLIAMVLTFIARPIAVFITTVPFKRSFNEKLMISWVGLRGAAPIVLATFPLTVGIPHAMEIFNIVFFVVIISVLMQGTTIPFLAKKLKVDAPIGVEHKSILEYDGAHTNNKMLEFTVPKNSQIAGKQIFELKFPKNSLVSLVYKNGDYLIPTGSTTVEADDVLFVLSDIKNEQTIRKIICEEIKDFS